MVVQLTLIVVDAHALVLALVLAIVLIQIAVVVAVVQARYKQI